MKQGAETTINDLNDDALAVIFSFVPESSHESNEHSPSLVCRRWNRVNSVQHAGVLADKIKFNQALINACQADPSKVLLLFQHESFYQRLNWKQFIRLCACHDELAKSLKQQIISEIRTVQNWLTHHDGYDYRPKLINDLVTLGSYNASIGLHILTTPQLLKLISYNRNNILALGRHHESIAAFILNTPTIRSQLNSGEIAKLASFHERIALALVVQATEQRKIWRRMFATPEMDDHDLALLAEHHETVAWAILNSPTLRYSASFLADYLAFRHSSITPHTLKTFEFYQRLTPHELISLSSHHEEVLCLMLNTPSLRNTLCKHEILDLLDRRRKKALKLVLNDTQLMSLFTHTELILLIGRYFKAVRQKSPRVKREDKYIDKLAPRKSGVTTEMYLKYLAKMSFEAIRSSSLHYYAKAPFHFQCLRTIITEAEHLRQTVPAPQSIEPHPSPIKQSFETVNCFTPLYNMLCSSIANLSLTSESDPGVRHDLLPLRSHPGN